MLWETKETAVIVALTDLLNRQFAYAVDNGTIGVYETGQRLWRVKVKKFLFYTILFFYFLIKSILNNL